ncbi:MAG: C45 family autoproteolytic acyltransferase/hydrolase, partial [Candidatus Xenobia bacterium]
EPFVVGMRVADCIVLTVAGCIGMMGMNRHGVGVAVNNLVSNDAQVGVIWPCLVRAMLEQENVSSMSEVLQLVPLCSGHNYLLGDRHRCSNWETSGKLKKLTYMNSGPGIFFHTNHYLDDTMRGCEGPIPVQSTTQDRYRAMEQQMRTLPEQVSGNDVVSWLSSHEGHPRSVCSHMGTDDPDASKTCGGVVCSLTQGSVTAWRGCLHEPGNGTVTQTVVRQGSSLSAS